MAAMPPPESSRLAFDDVVIDFSGRRLLRGGVVQSLEPKAFDVLALLARAPGRVFARGEILDAVWAHRHVTPGVLNRVMTLLRHALGENARAPRCLHTLHGVGYRFDLPAQSPPPARRLLSAGRWRWLLVLTTALALSVAVVGAAWWRWPEPRPGPNASPAESIRTP